MNAYAIVYFYTQSLKDLVKFFSNITEIAVLSNIFWRFLKDFGWWFDHAKGKAST